MKKSLSKLGTRLVALLLAAVTMIGIFAGVPIKADAASPSASKSINSVSVKSSGMYTVKTKTAALRGDPKDGFTYKYAILQKGALVVTCGSQGNFYKVNMNGRVYFIKKSELKSSSASTSASLYYTTKNAALRATPYESGTKATTLPKGSVVAVVGKLTNSHSNEWLIVHWNGGLWYLYSGNAKSASKVSLKVSGENMVAVDETTKLKYTTDPSAVVATWSSSDSSVATVDISGKVKGIAPGTAKITASIGGYLKVSFTITVYEYAIFPAKVLNITQVAYGSFSHGKQNAVDYNSGGRVVAPFTGKITFIDKNWGYVVIQSTHKVKFADGTFDYMTVSFMHDENLSGLYVGKIIKQGVAFYDMGGMGNGKKGQYPFHVHMAIWKGKTNGRPYGAGTVYVFNAMYIDRGLTTSFVNYGSCSKSRVNNNAPNNYKDLWRYLP